MTRRLDLRGAESWRKATTNGLVDFPCFVLLRVLALCAEVGGSQWPRGGAPPSSRTAGDHKLFRRRPVLDGATAFFPGLQVTGAASVANTGPDTANHFSKGADTLVNEVTEVIVQCDLRHTK